MKIVYTPPDGLERTVSLTADDRRPVSDGQVFEVPKADAERLITEGYFVEKTAKARKGSD